jgi:hypothetical protein
VRGGLLRVESAQDSGTHAWLLPLKSALRQALAPSPANPAGEGMPKVYAQNIRGRYEILLRPTGVLRPSGILLLQSGIPIDLSP